MSAAKAAQEFSPQHKLWVKEWGCDQALEGRKSILTHTLHRLSGIPKQTIRPGTFSPISGNRTSSFPQADVTSDLALQQKEADHCQGEGNRRKNPSAMVNPLQLNILAVSECGP
jgi:hypothetical protein